MKRAKEEKVRVLGEGQKEEERILIKRNRSIGNSKVGMSINSSISFVILLFFILPWDLLKFNKLGTIQRAGLKGVNKKIDFLENWSVDPFWTKKPTARRFFEFDPI